MKALFLLIGIFTTTLVLAQSDKEKFYMQQCSKWHFNYDSLQHYGRLLTLSEHPRAISEGYYALGYSHQKNLANDSALFYYEKADRYAKQLQDYKFRSRIIKNQAVSAGQAGDTELALEFIDSLEVLGYSNSDSLLLALSANQRGVFHKDWGEFEKSVAANTKAAKIYKELNHPNLVNSYTNLALVYVDMDLDSFAHHFFSKAYSEARVFNVPRLIDRAAGNLGNFYRNNDELDSALFYFNIQLQDTANLPNRAEMILFQNLAELNIQTGDLDKAKELIDLLEKNVSGKSSVRRKVEVYHVNMRYQMALENWSTALLYADSSEMILQKQKFTSRILPLLSTKAMLYEKLGQYDRAIQALKNYNALKDSLALATNLEAVEKIVAEYQLNEKENELQKLLVDNDQTNDYLKIAIFSVVAILIISGAVFYQRIKLQDADSSKEQSTSDYNKNHYIQLNSGIKLLSDEVVYVKSEGHYLNYILLNGSRPELDRDTMKSRSDELADHGFLRVHRSYLVNERHVVKVQSQVIELIDQNEVPLSKTYRQKLVEIGHPLFV